MMVFIEALQKLFTGSEIIITDEKEIQDSEAVEEDVFKVNFRQLKLFLGGKFEKNFEKTLLFQ